MKIYRNEELKLCRGSNIDQIRTATNPDHPVAHRQLQRHWNAATFCFFRLWPWFDDSPVIDSRSLIGRCNLDKSVTNVTNETQWNLILAGAIFQASHVACFCHFIANLPGDIVYRYMSQKMPISNGGCNCCKLISMQSVDVIWQLQCWTHCHVLVTVTFLYCFGHWPACYMELIMILVMVWRSRDMMGIAILETWPNSSWGPMLLSWSWN